MAVWSAVCVECVWRGGWPRPLCVCGCGLCVGCVWLGCGRLAVWAAVCGPRSVGLYGDWAGAPLKVAGGLGSRLLSVWSGVWSVAVGGRSVWLWAVAVGGCGLALMVWECEPSSALALCVYVWEQQRAQRPYGSLGSQCALVS